MERKSVNYQKANYVQREAIDVPYLSGSRCICPSLLLFPENFHFLFLFVFSIFVFFCFIPVGFFLPCVFCPKFFSFLCNLGFCIGNKILSNCLKFRIQKSKLNKNQEIERGFFER